MMSKAYEGEWVLSSIIADRASTCGDDIAVITDAESLTYGELGDQSARIAAALRELGVAPDDRIATMLDSNPRHLAAWFASAWAGAIEVPINTEYKGTFLEHVLTESGAKVLVCEERFVERLLSITAPDLEHVVIVGSPDVEAP